MLLNTCYNVAAKQTVRFSSPSGPWGWAEPATTAPSSPPSNALPFRLFSRSPGFL